ncbi:MAG: hypothetical protein PUA83_10050 [Clostridiales bacterium]|nr:hypothetical protein [Clostridiales bacterium]
MKSEELMRAMSGVLPEFIDDAAPGRKKKKFSPWLKWVSAAACLTVTAAGAVFFLRGRSEEPRWPVYEVTVPASPGTAPVETEVIKRWEEMSMQERFPETEFGKNWYCASGREAPLESAETGEYLGECSLEGYDIYTDAVYSAKAKVFAVAGISSECAVSLEFEDGKGKFVYVNSSYEAETLGDFIDDLNLEENLSAGNAYYNWHKPDGSFSTVRFDDFGDEIIWEMLLSDRSVPESGDTLDFATVLSVSIDHALLGYENITLSVTEDGYIWTNLLDSAKSFFLGTEKTEAFVEWVLENADGVELVTVYDTEEESGEAGVSESPATAVTSLAGN